MEDRAGRIVICRRTAGVLLFVFGLAMVLFAFSLSGLRLLGSDHDYYVLLRTQDEAQLQRKSPHIQLVGYVTHTRRYGLFSRGRKSAGAAEMSLTVLCKDGRYYTTGGLPRDYLRTLLREEDQPALAKSPVALQHVEATSDRDALAEAKEQVRKAFQKS